MVKTSSDKPIVVLVLGPMEQRAGGMTMAASRTEGIKNIVNQIGASLAGEPAIGGQSFEAVSPEDRRPAVIIPGILGMIETADLVVIDMSGGRANVGYEAGIVHALGLPYVILTSDDQPPFYFVGAEYISSFHFAENFDPDQPTHDSLKRRLRRFATEPDSFGAFADNQLTQHYGLPLGDIAGPSGLAAGYFRNCVRRFLRPGGFIDEPCGVTWQTSFETKDGVETRRTDKRDMHIGHLIAVRPHGGLKNPHSAHGRMLDDTLAKMGLRLQFATIQKRPKEYEDLRDFGGQLLARLGKKGDPVEFIEPAVVVDTPTTLYALEFSPRVRKLSRMAGTPLAAAMADWQARLLQRLQANFESNLDFQLQHEIGPGSMTRFHLVDVVDLPKTLDRIGVAA